MQIKIMLYISTSNQDEVIETRFIFLLEILKHNKKKLDRIHRAMIFHQMDTKYSKNETFQFAPAHCCKRDARPQQEKGEPGHSLVEFLS